MILVFFAIITTLLKVKFTECPIHSHSIEQLA